MQRIIKSLLITAAALLALAVLMFIMVMSVTTPWLFVTLVALWLFAVVYLWNQ